MGKNGGWRHVAKKAGKGHPLSAGIRLELFDGKWNSHIICVLAVLGILRYSELRREMGNITGLPDFFANRAGVLLDGGDAAGYIQLNLAMPRSIIETGLSRMAKAVREVQTA